MSPTVRQVSFNVGHLKVEYPGQRQKDTAQKIIIVFSNLGSQNPVVTLLKLVT